MSHSENKPKTTQTTTQTSRNLNVQDVAGVVVADSVGTTINQLDGGAIDRAFDLGGDALYVGLEALSLGGRVAESGFETGASLAGRGLDNAFAATERAISFGETALAENASLADRALGEIANFAGRALGEVSDSQSQAVQVVANGAASVLDFARSFTDRATSTADDRVTKIAIAAVVAFALFAVLRR